MEISLTQGKMAIIDDVDFEYLKSFKWYTQKMGNKSYAMRCVSGKIISMHREIMKPKSGFEIDHINGNGLDNRRENLRIATHQQNLSNRMKWKIGSSRFKGVRWEPVQGKWAARIRINGKDFRLGRYAKESDAAYAYDKAALRIFGDFAMPNFGKNGIYAAS